jgi:hypothetical protein
MNSFDQNFFQFMHTAMGAAQQQQNMLDQQIGGLLQGLTGLIPLGAAIEQQKQQQQMQMIQQEIEAAKQQANAQLEQSKRQMEQQAQEIERLRKLELQESQRKDEQISRQKKLVRPVQTAEPEKPKKTARPKIITEFYED